MIFVLFDRCAMQDIQFLPTRNLPNSPITAISTQNGSNLKNKGVLLTFNVLTDIPM